MDPTQGSEEGPDFKPLSGSQVILWCVESLVSDAPFGGGVLGRAWKSEGFYLFLDESMDWILGVTAERPASTQVSIQAAS